MTTLDEKTKFGWPVVLVIVTSLLASVGWLTKTAWDLERSVGTRIHSLETKAAVRDNKLEVIVDQLGTISHRLTIATDGLPDLRAKVNLLEKRVERLEKAE